MSTAEQNDKALRDMHVGDLKRVLRAASDDAKRAIEHVATLGRLGEDTLKAEADLHARVRYLLQTIASLQELQGVGTRPALTATSTVVRDEALAQLSAQPQPRSAVALLMAGVVR